MCMAKQTFDVMLATGNVWNAQNEQVYLKHIQNHLRLLDDTTYYALRVRNGPFRGGNPELFRWLDENLDLLSSDAITDGESYMVWRK